MPTVQNRFSVAGFGFRQLWVAALACALAVPSMRANPNGATVSQGTASISTAGSKMTIQTSDQTFINWQSFNIGVGETTTFVQPSSTSLVWNQINDPNPSQILGNLNANGYIVLQNQAGFYVGGQAAITAHGLIMTTAPIRMPDLSSGGAWQFDAPPPTTKIVNYGQINTGPGGQAFLIADAVENHGGINAPGGDIGLYAGKVLLLSTRPDGRGFSAQVSLPQGSVNNSGQLIADAGTIAMNAQVVNQGGLIQANSVQEQNGVIELTAGDSLNLAASSVISAKGDSQGTSPGGSVTLKSGNSYQDSAGSVIDISGGAEGGNGGQLEISGPQITSIQSSINGRAATGFSAGQLTIDPQNIVIDSSGDNAPPSGIVNPGDPPSANSPDTLTLSVSSLNNLISDNLLSMITLQATEDITVNTLWLLPSSSTPNSLLTLTAGHNINVVSGAGINAGQNWSIALNAGPQNLAANPGPGNDGIYLFGSADPNVQSAYLQTQNGNISLWAANEVQVGWSGAFSGTGIANSGQGSITTTAGGNISVTTQLGDINSGSGTGGFNYLASSVEPFYTVSTTLGGIGPAAGGNVALDAIGGDVISFPVTTVPSSDAGTGAFGPTPGNVSITAGGNVYGHFVLANGTGTINAGQNIGKSDAGENVALSLIDGSWALSAASGNIYLQEVRNPNGIFNNTIIVNRAHPGSITESYHDFDYGPQDSVTLNALNGGVFLTDASLPRLANINIPAIYPPSLTINAGPGGVVLSDNVILFPSQYGDLNITTTGGGNFENDPKSVNATPELSMSEKALLPDLTAQWTSSTSFEDGDISAGVPVEYNNPLDSPNLLPAQRVAPVNLDISGDMVNINLRTTAETQVGVQGDLKNSSIIANNLHPYDDTVINVTGQIVNASPYSFVPNQTIPPIPADDLPPNTADTWDIFFSIVLDPAKIPTVAQVQAFLQQNNEAQSQAAAYIIQQAGLFPSSGPGSTGNPGFVYNTTTGRLGFVGQMSPTVQTDLGGAGLYTVLKFGADGLPAVDSTGKVYQTDTVSWASPSAVQTLFTESQGAPSPSSPLTGYQVGGPGEFDVIASSISLGNSFGVLSWGVGGPSSEFANLAPITPQGASINVTSTGDLDMLTSTIAALGGGDVSVASLTGSMDLGSQELFGNATRSPAFGIFTSGGGNVTVTAQGAIDVDGSRIATYNGGNIKVESYGNSIDAGTGGTGFVTIPVAFVNTGTSTAGSYGEQVFGSGILANTLVDPSQVPGAATKPGNITVLTPNGNITASQGGIVQEALNGDVSAGPTILLNAGTPAVGTLGTPGYQPAVIGNIDLGNSGVIGGTVNVTATGNITGLVISRQDSTVNAAQNFSGTVLSGGSASVSAVGSVSGTIIGVTGATVSGNGGDANVLSVSANVNGQSSSTLGGPATASAAAANGAGAANDETKTQVGTAPTLADDDLKKKKPLPLLTRLVGRVRVLFN